MNLKTFFLLLILILACKKEVIPPPEAVVLIGPENNNSCTTALPINDAQSQVTFDWQLALNSNSYQLVIQDLTTGSETVEVTFRVSESTVLKRGRPYSWWVISKSERIEKVAKSEVWSFYLEGIQEESHLPFPAKLISPNINEQVSLENGEFTFRWEGLDLDGDIASYDFYLGEAPESLTLNSSRLTNPFVSIALESDTYYYWKIYTRDQIKNGSNSQINVFQTEP